MREGLRRVLRDSCVAAALYGGGDCIAQQLERLFQLSSPDKVQHNLGRTIRMTTFGFCVAGPILSAWYPLLHRITASFRTRFKLVQFSIPGWDVYRRHELDSPRHRMQEVGIKVLFDNLFFQPPFLTLYFVCTGALEGLGLAEIYDKTTRNFHSAWAYGLLLWVSCAGGHRSLLLLLPAPGCAKSKLTAGL
uniref:Uncharacterized protein n=1 Tax=Rhizochromulina marina TaxID=1034831 RepID=A0A7S2WPN9_9STRA|mmetsp:Transcript_30357/g.88326  ORF Transcript_30357/g.88326 Transcript_30357/m.88326 type:complete len:191 (+) Transcript_30357:116-688(+)